MIILGVTHPGGRNNAACLLVDGRLVAFAEEERFTRQKHAPEVFPARAVQFCFDQAGIRPEQVDRTAVGFFPPSISHLEPDDLPRFLRGELAENRRGLVQLLYTSSRVEPHGETSYVDHHVAHAASAAVVSGFTSCNVISVDGFGGASSGLLGSWRRGEPIREWRRIAPSNSWGAVYTLVTDWLGLKRYSGEGKTMGLAPYGAPDPAVLPDYCEPELGLPDLQRYKAYCRNTALDGMVGRAFTPRHAAIAATLQFYYQRSLVLMAKALRRQTGLGRFALAGGCALNCTGNGELARQDFVEDLFVQPAAHDAGTALGAALVLHHHATGQWPDVRFEHAYWGSGFDQDQIRTALDFAHLPHVEVDPAAETARALMDDETVGFFQGRAEVGPRALGGRSILANPMHYANLDRINLGVKRREPWRPLAPSVLTEHFADVVDARVDSPFMIVAFQARETWRARIPAVVHVDGSCRPQAVKPDSNPTYHRAISEFHRLSGVPVVLNTSFNLEDEPIVDTPDHAIATFCRSGLDTLVIGNFAVRKRAWHARA